MWFCVCDCGKERIVRGNDLRNGKTKACGCLQKEVVTERSTKHGYAKRNAMAAEYITWENMIARCTNPKATQYADWGGRGIKVCDRWLNSFENFITDMEDKPSSKHSIERKNVNGNYEPSNCRWATPYEQSANRRLSNVNTSGHKGVCWHKRIKKWQSRITFEDEEIHLGYFKNIEDAIKARKQAEIKYHNNQPSK